MVNQLFQFIRSRVTSGPGIGRVVILTSAVVTASLVGLRQMGTLQPLELNAYDQLMRLRPADPPDPRLLIVGVSEDDIQKRHEYPLKDATVLQLLRVLDAYHPRAIGLDIIRDVPIGEGQAELLDYLQQSDTIVNACKVQDATDPGFPPPKGVQLDQVGVVNLPIDPGGIARRALLGLTPAAAPNGDKGAKTANTCNNTPDSLFSLSMHLALRYLEPQKITLGTTPTNQIKLGPTVFTQLQPNSGPYQNADVGGYQLLLNYRSATNVAKQVSLTEALQGKLDPKWVKDKVVLVGYTARSVKDEVFTPYSTGQGQNQPMPGVIIHAQIVSQVLSTVLDHRSLFSFWPKWVEVAWILSWSVLAGVLTGWIKRPIVLAVAIVVSLGLLFGLGIGLFMQAVWVPLVPPFLAFVLTVGGVLFFSRGLAKAVVQSVKGFLKLNIEIDETKKQQDVDAIAQSDYFQHLQTKSEQLRRMKSEAQSPSGNDLTPTVTTEPATALPLTAPTPTIDAADHVEELIAHARQRRLRPTETKARQSIPKSQPLAMLSSGEPAPLSQTVLSNTAPLPVSEGPIASPDPLVSQSSSNEPFADLFSESLASSSATPSPSEQTPLGQLLHDIDECYQQLKTTPPTPPIGP